MYILYTYIYIGTQSCRILDTTYIDRVIRNKDRQTRTHT